MLKILFWIQYMEDLPPFYITKWGSNIEKKDEKIKFEKRSRFIEFQGHWFQFWGWFLDVTRVCAAWKVIQFKEYLLFQAFFEMLEFRSETLFSNPILHWSPPFPPRKHWRKVEAKKPNYNQVFEKLLDVCKDLPLLKINFLPPGNSEKRLKRKEPNCS